MGFIFLFVADLKANCCLLRHLAILNDLRERTLKSFNLINEIGLLYLFTRKNIYNCEKDDGDRV